MEVYEVVNDAKLTGVDICVPDFRDQQDIPYMRNNQVFFGLEDIKQIGQAALEKILTQAKEASVLARKEICEWSWLDYMMLFSSNVPSTVNEAIISCGGLDYMRKSRSSMLYELSLWYKLTKKEKEWIIAANTEYLHPNLLAALRVCAKTKKEGGGCHGAKRVAIVKDLCKMAEHPPYALHDTSDFIAWSEDKYLGASLTCSKVDGCEKVVEANATCRDVMLGNHVGYTVLAVEITRLKEIKTKKGKNPGQWMAFISASDNSCAIDDVVAFPETWKEYSGLIHEGNTLLIQGDKNNKKGSSFVIKKVWQI
jgi:DNA polymerase III alpha subunit